MIEREANRIADALEKIAAELKRFNDAAINTDGCLFITTDEVGH